MKRILLILTLLSWHCLRADTIDWSTRRGTLQKPDFNSQTASYQVSSTGGTQATFQISHLGTTAGKFTYSKWEIDRWGDPNGIFSQLGSWQAISSSANDVGLALWGAWGPSDTPLANGNSTSYQLTINFSEQVRSLVLPLRGINAFLDTQGNNNIDQISITSFLDDAPLAAPSITSVGSGIVQTSGTLNGNFASQIGTDTGNFNTSDQGSATLTFPGPLNKVVLTIYNEARHPTPASIQNAAQSWSVSLGNLTFEPVSTITRSRISWSGKKGSLSKSGENNLAATLQTPSDDGAANLTLKLSHASTTGNKFSFSKWEIDRWGDPNGVFTTPGSWQVMSNATNDVVLGLWGYWGTDGSSGSVPVAIGDKTSYRLTMTFDRPVTDLTFPLNGINAIIGGGLNSFDAVKIQSYLGTTALATPTFSNQGSGMTRSGDTLTGDFNHPISSAPPNISNQGSINVRFTSPLDKVIITLVNEAQHPTPASFQSGQQNWSFSVGEISFIPGISSEIEWESKRTTLSKAAFDSSTVNYQTSTPDGEVTASFQLSHLGTTGNKYTYSKWEIDRWGDPTGFYTSPAGAWQIMSNAANDVVFGVWGYWGTNNLSNQNAVVIGDQTSYQLSINFSKPVEDLSFFLNGINAFIKASSGFNSQDILTVASYLGNVAQGSPTYSQQGNAFTRSGNTLTGDYAVQINNGFTGQHISDQGSAKVSFTEPVDRVELTLINRAGHSDPAAFIGGQQTFSYSISSLDFTYDNEATGTSSSFGTSTTSSTTAGPVALGKATAGNMLIRVIDPLAEVPDLTKLEMSTNLDTWSPFSKTGASVRSIDGGVQIQLPASPLPASEFYRWRK